MIGLKNWRHLVNQLDADGYGKQNVYLSLRFVLQKEKTVLTHLIVKIVSIEVKTTGIVKAV